MNLRYALLALCLAVVMEAAQKQGCLLSGSVQDPSGAVFAGLDVELIEPGGSIQTAKTDDRGAFCFSEVPAAIYRLAINATGFQAWALDGIEIGSGSPRRLDPIRLALSDRLQMISVTASAEAVRAKASSRPGIITAEELDEMPLEGRDLLDAVGLTPGAVDLEPGRSGTSAQSLDGLHLLGGRAGSHSFLVDGISVTDSGPRRTALAAPGVRSVGEVRVLTSNYAAEYGRSSGGTISLVTRSGSKQFRGSADWLHRHESYAANDYFNNRNGAARQRNRAHLAGYTVSGPIYLGRRFNKDKSKAFFFFAQDFQSQLLSYGMRTVKTPTEKERAGNFSESFDVNGRAFAVYDPQAGQRPFPGQIIPADRFSQTGQNILSLFPLPNFVDPEPSRRNQWNYLSAGSGTAARRTETARFDYTPRRNFQIYSRVSHVADKQNAPYGHWATGAVNFPLTQITSEQPGWGAAIHTTATLSKTLVQTFIAGVSVGRRRYYPASPDDVSRQGTGIELPQWNPGLNPAGLLPNMSFGGVQNFANPSMANGLPYENSNTVFNFVEGLMKISGRHNYKTGFFLERSRRNEAASVITRGMLGFDRDRNNPLDTNYPYANALLGNFTTYSEATARPVGQFRYTTFEFYAQDAWRALRRLTLDFGVRFCHAPPQYDRRMQLAAFVPAAYDSASAPLLLRPAFDAAKKKVALDPRTGTTYPEALIGTFAPGSGSPSAGMGIAGVDGVPAGLYTLPALAAAPRLGFAWDPFGKGRTVVRGGFGVFLDRISGASALSALSNPPTVFSPLVYYGTLAGLAATSGQRVFAPAGSIASLGGRNHMPALYNFSFGVQRQVGKQIVIDASYIGSLARHLLWQRNLNPVPAGANHIDLHPENRDPTAPTRPLPRNFLRPYLGYGELYLYEFAATSNYHALLVSVNRRLARGVQIIGSYTWSKTLGAAAGEYSQVSPFFAPRERNYGPLPWDLRHVISLRYTWILPKPGKHLRLRVVRITADGWELSGISRFSSGAPFTPSFSTVDGQDITGTPSEYPRVDLVNPEAEATRRFSRPRRGTFGNTGPGILRANGINNWDLSLLRTFKLAERRTMQFRVESYNTFNHTQFQTLQSAARFDVQGQQVDPTFLQPTLARAPRRVQFALRLNW